MRMKPKMIEVVVDIEMTISSMRTDGMVARRARHPMVWLRSVETHTVLPIVIGSTEAMSIYAELTGQQTPRPLTHDLLRAMLDYFDAQVEEVRIVDLKDSIFYAELVLCWGGDKVCLDTRSSDGIAMALKYDAPVYMAEEILERAGCKEDIGPEGIAVEGMGMSRSESVEAASDEDMILALEDLLEEAGSGEPEAFSYNLKERINKLKKRLERAVRQERYEEAGRLWDEIARLKGNQEGQQEL